MEFTAKLGLIRITPRKAGALAREIRGKNINEVLTYLKFSPRHRISNSFEKLIKSAVANADQKGTVDVDKLYVKTLLVGQGPMYKRFIARAKGAGDRLVKKTCKITVVLAEKV